MEAQGLTTKGAQGKGGGAESDDMGVIAYMVAETGAWSYGKCVCTQCPFYDSMISLARIQQVDDSMSLWNFLFSFAFLFPSIFFPRSLCQEFKIGHAWVQQVFVEPESIRSDHVVDQVRGREPLRHGIRAPRNVVAIHCSVSGIDSPRCLP